MVQKSIQIPKSKILLLGFTFKENCPDIRNTRVIDIYNELKGYDVDIDIYDPWANEHEVMLEYGIKVYSKETSIKFNTYSAIILTVAHNSFLSLEIKKSPTRVVFDVKGVLNKDFVDARL